jgi:hypothetical protein
MKIFYLRDNVVGMGEVRTEDGGRSIIPPEGCRLVKIRTEFSSTLCAVKKNDYRHTIQGLGNYETVDLSKVVWTKSAADVYKKKCGGKIPGFTKKQKPEKPEPVTQKKPNDRQTLLSVLPFDTRLSLNHSSGEFEKNFKSLIREQGSGADSLMTARFLVYSMPPGDKSELNKNLLSNGVKSSGDLTRLLSKWRSETLLANHKPERTLRRGQTLSAEYER